MNIMGMPVLMNPLLDNVPRMTVSAGFFNVLPDVAAKLREMNVQIDPPAIQPREQRTT